MHDIAHSPAPCSGACGCQPCACAQVDVTPLPRWNRPGLPRLRYRVGTHSAFMAAMQDRLASITVDLQDTSAAGTRTTRLHPLQGLTTRESNDPALALLDGWACLGEVLTFYQERIANEGYLRTAQERRSVLEMARLVGYALRPGVAASVFLAFTLDEKQTEPVDLPVGTRAQSLPGPNETAQVFETSEVFTARAAWNNLQARSEAAQDITLANALGLAQLVVAGSATQLKTGDAIVLLFEQTLPATQVNDQAGQVIEIPVLRRIAKVEADAAKARTTLVLQPLPPLLQALAMPLYTMVQAVAQATILASDSESHRYNNLSIINAAKLVWQQTLLGYLAPIELVLSRINTRLHTSIALVNNGNVEGTVNNSLSSNLFGAYIYAENEVLPAVKNALESFEAAATQIVSHWPPAGDFDTPGDPVRAFVNKLLAPLQAQVANSQQLARSLSNSFRPQADAHPQLLLNLAPGLRDHFYTAWENADLGQTSPPLKAAYALRATLALFGASSAKRATFEVVDAHHQPLDPQLLPQNNWADWPLDSSEDNRTAFLENVNASILPGSLAIIQNGQGMRTLKTIKNVETVNRSAYGISAKSSKLSFADDWWSASNNSIDTLRQTLFLVQSDELTLAKALITTPVAGNSIDLAGLYQGLQSGRFVIVSGERADIAGVAGIRVSELMMISSVTQNDQPKVPGESLYTTLQLATSLAYRYRRDSLTIYANVVRANHGETRSETLGSGDASANQRFTLKQAPLTFVSASNAQGVASTLSVTVDNITWHESDSLPGSGANGRRFVTFTNDDNQTSIVFGNGRDGARLPSGVENIKAVYRQGIGKSGNVRAGQISQLLTRPLGVREVLNPVRASGGADRETRDQARKNVPLAVMALDRLVSLSDYAAFARTFGGIGKAEVARLYDGRRELIHLTIAGVDDAPIDPSSDLMRNLQTALRRLGDTELPLVLQARELVLLILSANIRIDPDYQWEVVEQAARQSVLDTFSFDRRELGQSALLCEVIAAIQNVPGVVYVDVDSFGGVPEKITSREFGNIVRRDTPTPAELAELIHDIIHPPVDEGQGANFAAEWPGASNVDGALEEARHGSARKRPADRVDAGLASASKGNTLPAQLLLFTGNLPDTLILNQIK